MEVRSKRKFDAKVSINIDERYTLKDGSHNVTITVYHNGQYYHYLTGVRCKKYKDLEDSEQDYVEGLHREMLQIVEDMFEEGTFNIESLKEFLMRPKKNSINALMRDRIDELKKDNKFSTAGHYTSALQKFESVFKETITFDKINVQVFNKFDRAMEEDGLSVNTRLIYLSDFKAVINRALADNLMSEKNYPFKTSQYDKRKFEFPTGGNKRRDQYLTKEEIKQVYEYYLNCKKIAKPFIGMFLFSYFANGLNFADMFRLKWDQHFFDTDQKELCFIRRKTQEKSSMKIRIPYLDFMKQFVTTQPEFNTYVFNCINDKMTEKEKTKAITNMCHRIHTHLNTMSTKLGLSKTVTATYARHSFNTNMINLAVPLEYVDYAMGHCKGLQSHYFGGYSYDTMIEYNSRLVTAIA